MNGKLLTHPLRYASFAGMAALFVAPALNAAVQMEDFDLGASSQSSTQWTNLASSNVGLVADSGGDGGTFAVASPGYQAGFGIYSFSTDYSVTVTQGASYDIQSVVFQLELSPPSEAFPYSTGPLLSINGGAFTVAATFFAVGATEARYTFGEDPITYVNGVWQWDLSGYADTITSVSVLAPIEVHTSMAGATITTGSSFSGYVSPVPEASTLILSVLGFGAVLRRRR